MFFERNLCWCDGCGVEITWGPRLKGGRPYCCPDCLHGWPCRCRERVELEDERRSSSGATLPTGGAPA